jgi:hypothetical protein
VISERKRIHPQFFCPCNKLRDLRESIEEGIVRMRVKMSGARHADRGIVAKKRDPDEALFG